MRSLALIGLGIGFILMGAGLFALTLRKRNEAAVNLKKSQLREQAVLAEESRKLRIAAGASAVFGTVLVLLTYF